MAENILFEDNFDDMSNQVVTASAGTVTAVSNRAELFHTAGISWNVNGFRMSTSVLGFAGMKVQWKWAMTKQVPAQTDRNDAVFGVVTNASFLLNDVTGIYTLGFPQSDFAAWEKTTFSSTDTPQPGTNNFGKNAPEYTITMTLNDTDDWTITVSGEIYSGSTPLGTFMDEAVIDPTCGTSTGPFIGQPIRFACNTNATDTPGNTGLCRISELKIFEEIADAAKSTGSRWKKFKGEKGFKGGLKINGRK